MLPQTLPIRFLLNRRKGATVSSGSGRDAGPKRVTRKGKTDEPFWEPGAPGLNQPWSPESDPAPLHELHGLGKALGLETLWFKEGGSSSIRRPQTLMQAYEGLAREIIHELGTRALPTHIFLQAGTGDFAAVIAGHLVHTLGDGGSPLIVIVEPANADCVLESVLASRPTPDSGTLETNMEVLACREVSPFAWGVLKDRADAFLSISDHAAEATAELLKEGVAGDPAIITRPSGAAGLAGLIAASFEPALTEPLGLGRGSRVLALGWEGPA